MAFSCPSMGAEQLEESEFEPLFAACRPELQNRKIRGLFRLWLGRWRVDAHLGSRGSAMARVSPIGVCNETPDDEAQEACIALGRTLA